MKAIQVKYLPATNHRVARFKASTGHDTATVRDFDDLDFESNELFACQKLMKKLRWTHEMVRGTFNGNAYFVPRGATVCPNRPINDRSA
jgi:hypothetical protein